MVMIIIYKIVKMHQAFNNITYLKCAASFYKKPDYSFEVANR